MRYPEQLGRLLGPGYNVTNWGNSGKTMLKGGLCLDEKWPPYATTANMSCTRQQDCPGACCPGCSLWDQPSFADALASKPDIVTIMLGTNDAKFCNWFGPPNGVPAGVGTQFAADYAAMVRRFQALPSRPRVYVVSPPPLTVGGTQFPNATTPPFNMTLESVNQIFPKLQRQIARY
jgi:hypothetical protein